MPRLPIDSCLDKLSQTLAQHNCVLLSAAPGAGKTTVVPLHLWQQGLACGRKILMLEPRRMAARNAATFMAQSLNEPVGETVGYRIRLEQKISTKTAIEVVTEGVLTRLLQADPELTDYGLIIFDEFHERHLHTELGLALSLQSQALLRDDLKILIMSATLDGLDLATKLNAPLIESAGQSYPLTLHYRPQPLHNSSLLQHCTAVIFEALQQSGDILVFLPGVREINQLTEQLAEQLAGKVNAEILPLHGSLKEQQQRRALRPSNQRKIILATNIAESSLTIDGVRIVIDSGLERRNEFHLASGQNQLKTGFISQASSVQRAGRAARQAEGVCFRLWSESQQHSLEPSIRPEIAQSDLAPLLLELKQWGAEADELFWLTPPPAPALNQATDLLSTLALLNPQGQLTEHGKACAQLGIEPRLAHALLVLARFENPQAVSIACELIALMQEFPNNLRQSDDLLRLMAQAQADKHRWNNRILPLATSLKHKLSAIKATQNQAANLEKLSIDDVPALFLALAYPDRIAKARGQNQDYLLANGRGAKLLERSDLIGAGFLACSDISIQQQGIIRLAAVLPEHIIEQLKTLQPQFFHTQTRVGFQDNGQYIAEEQQTLGSLVLSSKALPVLTAEQWQQAWNSYFNEHGLALLNWDTQALQLKARMQLLQEHFSKQESPAKQENSSWPDMSDEALLENLEQWLLPFLTQARHVRDLAKVNLTSALLSLLDWQQQRQLAELAPTHLPVPSGSNIQLDYQASPPVLAVKLQEMFGQQQTPSILNGQLAVMVHLLSPARRPVQITQDLAYFWQHSYHEVRKDLRGRYPKHPWPENPLEAQATRFTKNKSKQN